MFGRYAWAIDDRDDAANKAIEQALGDEQGAEDAEDEATSGEGEGMT